MEEPAPQRTPHAHSHASALPEGAAAVVVVVAAAAALPPPASASEALDCSVTTPTLSLSASLRRRALVPSFSFFCRFFSFMSRRSSLAPSSEEEESRRGGDNEMEDGCDCFLGGGRVGWGVINRVSFIFGN
jgi:hypothetical protein